MSTAFCRVASRPLVRVGPARVPHLSFGPSLARTRPLVFYRPRCSSKEAPGSKEEPKSKIVTGDESDGEDDVYAVDEILSKIDPAAVIATENCIKAFLLSGAAGLLAGWVGVGDPYQFYKLDMQHLGDAAFGVQACVPVILACTLMLALPTPGFPDLNRKQLDTLSGLEDGVVSTTKVEVNLDAGGSEDAEPPLVDGTAAPGVSGLRLAQLWISKPFYPLFTNKQSTILLASSFLNIAANELLVRGTMVAWIMNGLRSAVANADSSSVLFWSKVFRLASEDTLRWGAVGIIAFASALASLGEASRAQEWAREVLKALGREEQEALQASSAAAASTSATESAAAAQPSASSTSSTGGASAAKPASFFKLGIGRGPSAQPGSEAGGSEGSKEGASQGGEGGSTAGSSSTASQPKDLAKELTVVNSIKFRPGSSQVELVQAVEAVEVRTREDELVYAITAAFAVAQVLQVNFVFGATGNLLAPLATRIVMDVWGTAVVRTATSKAIAAVGPPATKVAPDSPLP